jgi:heme A synthase
MAIDERSVANMSNPRFMPSDYWKESKGWRNVFENMATVQFNHRTLGYITYFTATGIFFLKIRHVLDELLPSWFTCSS